MQIMISKEVHVDGWCSSPICIGSTIWITQSNFHYAGLIEYYPDSHTTGEINPFPATFAQRATRYTLISCKYKDDSIVVVNPYRGKGIVFNTNTKNYGNTFSFDFEGQLGHLASCLVIGDYIHIFHGDGGDYIAHPLIENTSINTKTECFGKAQGNWLSVGVLKTDDCYQSGNKMLIFNFARNQSDDQIPTEIINLISKFCAFEVFQFGGYDRDKKSHIDSFWIGH